MIYRGKSSQRLLVKANRQLTGKLNSPKTRISDCSVDLDPQIDKTINSFASNPSPAHPNTLPSTHNPAEGTPLTDLSLPASIHGPALRAPTPPRPVRPNPTPLGPAQLAPAPSPSPVLRTNSVTFGPGTVEALPYATTVQTTYPLPVVTPTDDIATTANTTAREILSAPSLLLFLASKQRKTLGSLSEGVMHPAAALIQSYVEEGITAHTGLPWSPQELEKDISRIPQASACTQEMTTFIRGDIQRRIKDGFIILFLAADTVWLFGEKLNLSHIAVVPQAHRRPRLILSMSEKTDVGKASVNKTTDRETIPESLRFGRDFPRILQAVWEADPAQGLVLVSNLDVTDAYHRGTVRPSQVGSFVYVVPLAPGDKGCIICIELALQMEWVDSPKFFYAFSETLIDVENALVNTDLPVPSYSAISEIPTAGPGSPHLPESLTHVDCYMDGAIAAVQGEPDHQHRVFDGTVRALKWLLP